MTSGEILRQAEYCSTCEHYKVDYAEAYGGNIPIHYCEKEQELKWDEDEESYNCQCYEMRKEEEND